MPENETTTGFAKTKDLQVDHIGEHVSTDLMGPMPSYYDQMRRPYLLVDEATDRL